MVATCPYRAGGLEPRCDRAFMPFGIGLPEVLIFLVVVLLLFGASRVPEIGRSLGKGMREFKDAVTGRDDDEPAPSLPRAPEDEEKVASPSREHDRV
ncbi:MAG: twin-arginine translocase TatA/TatE family subunit, partial [Gaiellales bacterium]